jgi:hypothetical protein
MTIVHLAARRRSTLLEDSYANRGIESESGRAKICQTQCTQYENVISCLRYVSPCLPDPVAAAQSSCSRVRTACSNNTPCRRIHQTSAQDCNFLYLRLQALSRLASHSRALHSSALLFKTQPTPFVGTTFPPKLIQKRLHTLVENATPTNPKRKSLYSFLCLVQRYCPCRSRG